MKTSQPCSLPPCYFLCLFRHKPINSVLSSQPLINPFRTEIMLNTGDWGQAWNYPSCSVVMTFTSSVWSVCLYVCVCLRCHTGAVFLCLCLIPLDYHYPFVKATHMCYLPSLISICREDMRSCSYAHTHTHTHTQRVVSYTLCGVCNMFLLPLVACRPHRGPIAFCSYTGQPHTLTGSDVVINLCQTWSGRVC